MLRRVFSQLIRGNVKYVHKLSLSSTKYRIFTKYRISMQISFKKFAVSLRNIT